LQHFFRKRVGEDAAVKPGLVRELNAIVLDTNAKAMNEMEKMVFYFNGEFGPIIKLGWQE
jgi:hypothetical protein